MEEEFVHHVDPDDQVLGRVSRDEAHRSGLLHRAGCVVIYNNVGSVLLARRAKTKTTFGGCWDWACSFHVAWGESYEQAAVRELEEETGIVGTPEGVGTVLVDEAPDHLVVRVFRLQHEGPIKLDPAEAVGAQFMTAADVETLLASQESASWVAPSWSLIRPVLG